ncbi:MAG: tRNA (guanosine(37)-N1)-methyltransferase TrmD [Clostridia bacterium]|nr:tRNA (guanosine(37)-N1)-methyltransferase TrmD [Clostridia bacterium]
MRIDILTLFPEMFAPLKTSLIGKALERDAFELNIVDIREFSQDKHKKCDDYPYGGGAGMLMTPQPLYDAITSVKTDDSHIIYLSPSGRTLKQEIVKEFATNYKHLVLVCGHYEGIDYRINQLLIDEEISVGDYVLTGGELPAMVLTDAICRYLPNVLHSSDSVVEESFENNLLEYPQYTRPAEFKGLKVPAVLLSGNHKEIADFRKEQAIEMTKLKRPDLLEED